MTEDGIGVRVARALRGPWLKLMGAAAAPVILVAAAGGPVHAASPMQLTYRVTHSVFGNIGTYSNTIEPAAGGTTVQTRAHFEVKMLGVKMYREDVQRTERWQGNRLVSFSGVTSKGNNSMVVRGEARGNSFLINSPQGTITAPASVHPANPWSSNFLASSTMMRPDDGKIEKVRVSGGQPTTVTLDGRPVRAQKYEVDGSNRYDVWLDNEGVPVKFAAVDDSGTVTFTLARCTCNVFAAQQLGMK